MTAGGRRLADASVADVEETLARTRRVLVPVGSTEQHGRHAPLGTDALLASEVCDRVAARVDALVAPAIPFGVSLEHEGFAGLVSLTPLTMLALVRDVCVSLSRSGFRHIVLVNGHYSNAVVLAAAVLEASDQLAPGTVVYPLNYWEALPPEQLEEYLSVTVGLHANIGETSAVMAIDPSLVRLDRAESEYPDFTSPPTPASIGAYFFSGRGTLHRALPTGVWGDPRGSSAELGRAYLDQIEVAVARFVEEAEAAFGRFGDE